MLKYFVRRVCPVNISQNYDFFIHSAKMKMVSSNYSAFTSMYNKEGRVQKVNSGLIRGGRSTVTKSSSEKKDVYVRKILSFK